jgi:YlmC/YmxH family sporulation protein
MMKISELQTKDVVNILDGRKLGTVTDLDINLHQGRIDAIICPGEGKLFGLLSGGEEIVIPWRNIVKIGNDVILVRLDEASYFLEDEEDSKNEDKRPPVYRPYTHHQSN